MWPTEALVRSPRPVAAGTHDRPDGYPRSLAVDGHDNLVAAVLETPTGNAIETHAPGVEGPTAPIRRISGHHTELRNGLGFGGSSGASVVLAYSSLTGRIYASVSGCGRSSRSRPSPDTRPVPCGPSVRHRRSQRQYPKRVIAEQARRGPLASGCTTGSTPLPAPPPASRA
jgi:hypothetical protein